MGSGDIRFPDFHIPMTDWAVNQGKTLIAIQVSDVLFRHLRGCILVGAYHSYTSESYVTRDALLRGGVPSPTDYFSTLITPTPIAPRSRSGYFSRAHSACSLVLKGFDNGVNWPSSYL